MYAELAQKAVNQAGAGMQVAGAVIGAAASLIPDERRFSEANLASRNLIAPNTRNKSITEWFTPGKTERVLTAIGAGISAGGQFLQGNAEGISNLLGTTGGVPQKVAGKPAWQVPYESKLTPSTRMENVNRSIYNTEDVNTRAGMGTGVLNMVR